MTKENIGINSICILRLSAIGDVCNAIAVAQAIQDKYSHANITWICGKVESELLKHVDGINIVVFDKKLGWQAYKDVWKKLKNIKFDVLLHMQSSIRASLISLGISATRKIGFDKKRSYEFQWFFCNEYIKPTYGDHVLDGFIQFVKKLDIKIYQPKWDIKHQSEDLEWAKNIIKNKKTLIISPSSSKSYKNWLAYNYGVIADYAFDKGMQVIIVGSPNMSDVKFAKQICNSMKNETIDLTGSTNLSQLWALISEADLLLSPDSGPAHMANAVNTPVLSLFAHHNPMRVAPYNFRDYAVSVWQEAIEQETGKLVVNLPWRARVKDINAIGKITIQQVKNKLDFILHEILK